MSFDHMYLLGALALVACIAVVVPFIPGWIELRRGKDSQALHINMDYNKSPFFYGDQFEALLKNGLRAALGSEDLSALEQKEYTVTLSQPEPVSVVTEPAWDCGSKRRVNTIVYATGNVLVGKDVRFTKEVFTEGNTVIGPGARMRTLLCKGELKLSEGSSVLRWADVRGGILYAGAGSNLGRNAISSAVLFLERGCRFGNLYGHPIRTFPAVGKKEPTAEGNIREKALVANSLLFSVPSGAVLRNNIVSSQDLKICSGATVHGDIKGLRNVELEDGVVVHGTIVADGNVVIGSNCRVFGTVFAQGDIRLGAGTIVGEKGHVKSVVSRSAVILEADVAVHGYIGCEKGRVVEE